MKKFYKYKLIITAMTKFSAILHWQMYIGLATSINWFQKFSQRVQKMKMCVHF